MKAVNTGQVKKEKERKKDRKKKRKKDERKEAKKERRQNLHPVHSPALYLPIIWILFLPFVRRGSNLGFILWDFI